MIIFCRNASGLCPNLSLGKHLQMICLLYLGCFSELKTSLRELIGSSSYPNTCLSQTVHRCAFLSLSNGQHNLFVRPCLEMEHWCKTCKTDALVWIVAVQTYGGTTQVWWVHLHVLSPFFDLFKLMSWYGNAEYLRNFPCGWHINITSCLPRVFLILFYLDDRFVPIRSTHILVRSNPAILQSLA